MRDELTQLLDAWGRREAAGAHATLPPLGPSRGFIAAARAARMQRLVLRIAAIVAIIAVVVFVVVALGRWSAPMPASVPTSLNTAER